MAQVEPLFQNSCFPASDPAALSRSDSASSVLSATAFGGYRALPTPTFGSSYGSMPWSGMNAHSPSIWSPNHAGGAPWPQQTPSRTGSLLHPGNYSYYPRPSSTFVYPTHLYQQRSGQQQMVLVPQVPVSQSVIQVVPQNVPLATLPVPVPQLNVPMQPVGTAVAMAPVPMQQFPPVQPLPSAQQLAPAPQLQPMLHSQGSANAQPVPAVYQPVAPLQPVTSQAPTIPLPPAGMQQHFLPQFYPSAPHLTAASYVEPQDAMAATDGGVGPEYDAQLASKFVVAAASNVCQHLDISLCELQTLEAYVRSLLYATHLSKATLLMCLVILNRAINAGVHLQMPGHPLKSLLTAAFVLANKMNDDNTFTNASWSMVTGFPTKFVTEIELSFLNALDWRLNLDDKNLAEWHYWDTCWQEYELSSQSCYPPSPLSPLLWPQSYVPDTMPVAAC